MPKEIITNPPWLVEAADAGRRAWPIGPHEQSPWLAVARAVLAFAARQPRPITDAMVSAAVSAMMDYDEETEARGFTNWHDYGRAALEAAEAVRTKEATGMSD